ncbi:hypothetical protein [Streptomyces kanamyceticus]|uniref:hypothetical protein n=1 Tax=Streptomyces kanamyceticus TaxID=1967 RepID=UPI0037DBFF4F
MTETLRALRIDLDGKVTDLDLGATLHQQKKILGRAVRDSLEVVTRIRQPDGTTVVALAGEHRQGKHPNFYASLAVDDLGGGLGHSLQGPVVFAQVTDDGELTALLDAPASAIKALCPAHPDGISVFIHLP